MSESYKRPHRSLGTPAAEGLVSTSAAEEGQGAQLWHQPSAPAFAPAQQVTSISSSAEACGMGEEKHSRAHLIRLRELVAS